MSKPGASISISQLVLPVKRPKWRDSLMAASSYSDMDYTHLRDCMQYLRSMRTILDRRKKKEQYLTMLVVELARALRFHNSADLLAKQNIIHSLEDNDLGPEVPYTERLALCGIRKERGFVSEGVNIRALSYLEEGGRGARAKEWQYRVEVALTQCISDGWYPLFGTYTVDGGELPKECLGNRDNLWKMTPAWDRFVKKFKTEAAEACGYGRKPAKWPEAKSFFQYFAIIEHGSCKAQDHPHVHVIWMLKEIPCMWKIDPNCNVPDRTRTDIGPATRLWRWGRCACSTQGVFISGSWFSDNWRKPQKKGKDGILRPMKVGGVGAIAGYLGKYMTKGDKKWNHRVKATKSLGLGILGSHLAKCQSLRLLRSLASRPMEFSTAVKFQTVTRLPMAIVRRKSKEELLKRLHTLKQPRAKRLLWRMMTAKPSEFFMRYLDSVQDGARPWRQSREECYKLFSQIGEVVPLTVHCRDMVSRMETFLIGADGTEGPSLDFTRLDPIELY